MTQTTTGGCQCGQVRFEAKPPELSAYFCHCRMCQRAVGNIFASFVNLPKADVRWTTREPDYYASTMFARRGFCSACGTPLTFDYPDSDVIDLTLGAFDDPSLFTFRSEEHTSELQSLMRISYAVFCLKKKTKQTNTHSTQYYI